MQIPHSSTGNGFDSTPPMSASSSMSTASTSQSFFYPVMSNNGGQYQHHHPNGGQPFHPQIRVSPSDGTGVGGVFHEIPQGRFVYPGQPSAMTDRRFSMSGSPGPDDGLFMPMSSSTHTTPFHSDMTSPSMGTHMSFGYPPHTNISPTDEMRQHQYHQQQHAPQIQQRIQQRERGRPALNNRHSMPTQPPQFAQLGARPPIQRHMSLHTQAQQPARSASPHFGAVGDVFDANPADSPVTRPLSSLGLPLGQMQDHPPRYDSALDLVSHSFPVNSGSFRSAADDLQFQQQSQQQSQEQSQGHSQAQSLGITPARALGPAPAQAFSFGQSAQMCTPDDKRAMPLVPSSSMTAMSEISELSTDSTERHTSVDHRQYAPSSDGEEHDSPTRVSIRLRKTESSSSLTFSRTVKARPSVVGCRTSAKFEKVAEDPGVEGVPPGPRSFERPGPSFACIIGQAILSCSAGGLSLEHIYRYVETMYPYFSKGDGAWRNSVRHNLSIHKMFETIPRSEKYPAGKGGIWIIHEDEKCHWPSKDKFIKNFPVGHPHHANCRQTLHDAEKENQAREKAEKEGRAYVPKKVKKAKKGVSIKEEDGDATDMARSSSAQTAAEILSSLQPLPPTHPFSTLSDTPFNVPSSLPFDHSEFTPMKFADQAHAMSASSFQHDASYHHHHHHQQQQQQQQHLRAAPQSAPHHPGGIPPQRFGSFEQKRRDSFDGGDENFFASNVKRSRINEPTPLRPVHAEPEQYLEDSFITPERERPGPSSSTVKMAQSSAFKTPALVNTSSSPGSSPMPPTLPRGSHNPSALQQAWTHDDMADDVQTTPPPILDVAFDFKPKAVSRAGIVEEFFPEAPISTAASGSGSLVTTIATATATSLPACPQTPTERRLLAKPHTPRSFTPRWGCMESPSFSQEEKAYLSTPRWEAAGVLDRLINRNRSPSGGSGSTGRSPRYPPFSPTSATSRARTTSSGSPRKIKDLIE